MGIKWVDIFTSVYSRIGILIEYVRYFLYYWSISFTIILCQIAISKNQYYIVRSTQVVEPSAGSFLVVKDKWSCVSRTSVLLMGGSRTLNEPCPWQMARLNMKIPRIFLINSSPYWEDELQSPGNVCSNASLHNTAGKNAACCSLTTRPYQSNTSFLLESRIPLLIIIVRYVFFVISVKLQKPWLFLFAHTYVIIYELHGWKFSTHYSVNIFRKICSINLLLSTKMMHFKAFPSIAQHALRLMPLPLFSPLHMHVNVATNLCW